ncbi:MAG: type I methionyl aminopeptidase [Candidatus Paceibacterota bacterium]
MAIQKKTEKEIEILREGGKRLAAALFEVVDMIVPGVRTDELDTRAEELLSHGDDRPAFLNYTPSDASRPFPASVCVSINDEIVHGIPNENPRTLKEGDIVSLDMGLVHNGLITDSSYTVPVGEVSDEAQMLLKATQEALNAGISTARGGSRVGDISAAIEAVGRSYNLGIFPTLVGHGVGYELHEEPYIPNIGRAGTGPILEPGLVIAIEPMFSLGSDAIKTLDDGYTYATKDGSLSAQFEHTIVITEEEPIILTQRPV